MATTDGTSFSRDGGRAKKFELPGEDVSRLTDAGFVERLIEAGASRLTAERIVAIERGAAEAGRARAHSQSRP